NCCLFGANSMRGIVALCLLVGLTSPTDQLSTEQSNRLAPKEAADGWLQLFDGDTPFGWTANLADKLTNKDGALRLHGAGTLQTTTAFHEFALEFQCRITGAKTHEDVSLNFAGATAKMAVPNDKNPGWRRA